MPESDSKIFAKAVRIMQDNPFCIERAIVRLEKARQKIYKMPAEDTGILADISIALHYLREVRRGL